MALSNYYTRKTLLYIVLCTVLIEEKGKQNVNASFFLPWRSSWNDSEILFFMNNCPSCKLWLLSWITHNFYPFILFYVCLMAVYVHRGFSLQWNTIYDDVVMCSSYRHLFRISNMTIFLYNIKVYDLNIKGISQEA